MGDILQQILLAEEGGARIFSFGQIFRKWVRALYAVVGEGPLLRWCGRVWETSHFHRIFTYIFLFVLQPSQRIVKRASIILILETGK